MLNTLMLVLALVVQAQAEIHAPDTPSLTPPTRTYCMPVAYRDYELLVGRTALIRPRPGCKRGSLIRKVSDLSGNIFDQQFVPLPYGSDYQLPRVYLYFSHLEYSLDGQRWNYLGLYP